MELLFVLYLLSGIFKSFALLFGISFPIDLTLLFALLTLADVFIRSLNFHNFSYSVYVERKKTLLLFFVFWCWMAFTLLYTSSPQYSSMKTFLFCTNFVPFIVVLMSKRFNIKLFLKIFSFFSVLLTLLYLPLLNVYTQLGGNEEMHDSIGGLYLTLGGYLGVSILFLLTTQKPIFSLYIDKIIIVCSFFLLLIIGARGPLLFTVLCSLLYLLRKKQFSVSKRKIINFFLFLLCTIAVIGILQRSSEDSLIGILFERSMLRLSLIIDGLLGNGDMGNSANIRVEFYEHSYLLITRSIENFILGTGVGSFSIETNGVDGRGYPHNLILEVWTEMGVVGVVFFLSFITTLFSNIRAKKYYISEYVILYFLLEYSKSGSLVDIRTGLTFCVLFICSANMGQHLSIPNGKLL